LRRYVSGSAAGAAAEWRRSRWQASPIDGMTAEELQQTLADVRAYRQAAAALPFDVLKVFEPLADERMIAIVKVFGCRPCTDGAAGLAAGLRKPPREETAMGERMMPRS